MSKYKVLWVASGEHRRDYKDRQFFANQRKADLYLALHFNASAYDKPGTDDNPCSVIVCDNASDTSKEIAIHLANLTSDEWDFPNRGLDIVGRDRAGYWNLFYTNMPAVLTELLYVSDPAQAAIARSEEGQNRLAQLHYETIKKFFPNGATIAISIEHKFKVSAPFDRGAPVTGTDNLGEADLTEMLAKKLAILLEADGQEEDLPDEYGRDEALEMIATGLEQAARGARMLLEK